MGTSPIWQVQKCDGAEYLVPILEFLLPEYSRIFGHTVMMTAPCIVYNDPDSECPQFNHTQPLSIRLSQEKLSFWSQTIYQLSHELCHYAIYQTKREQSQTLSWFEEIVCEAMSLYALHYAAEHWHECKLSKMSPDFHMYIREYLNNQLTRVASNEFMQCNTVEKLKAYELNEVPENNRATHVSERNSIFEAILQNPTEASCFLHYQEYIQPENGVILDFSLWYKNDPKNMVLQLLDIFPIKNEEK